MKSLVLLLLFKLVILTAFAQPVRKLYDESRNALNDVGVNYRRRKSIMEIYSQCNENQYFDETTRQCLNVVGGGRVLYIDNKRSCGINILKSHCTNPRYYYICKKDKTLLVQCAYGRYFEHRVQKCVPIPDEEFYTTTMTPSMEAYNYIQIPYCTRLGTFSIPGECSLFYTCTPKRYGMQQTFYRCPNYMAYDPETTLCTFSRLCQYSLPCMWVYKKGNDTLEEIEKPISTPMPPLGDGTGTFPPCETAYVDSENINAYGSTSTTENNEFSTRSNNPIQIDDIDAETSTITEETTTQNSDSTLGTEQTVEETPRSPTTTVGPIRKGSSSVDPDSLISSDESPMIGIHLPASTKLPHTWTEETSTITEETSTITEETSTITEETSTITEETSTITEETTTENADSTLGTEQTVEETPRSPTTTEGPICKGSSSVDPDSLISSDESPIIGIHLPASTKLPHTWTEGTSTITEETSTITEETSTITEETSTITEETSTITEETSTITEETTTENADSTLGTEQTVEETPRSPTTTEGPICKGSSSVDPDSLISSDESPIIGIHLPASTKLPHTWTEGTSTITEETSTITEETSTITEETSTITEETSTITEETTTENADSTLGTEQTVEETPRSPTTTEGPICKGSSSVDPDSLSSSDESPIIGIHPPASTKLLHTWTEETSTITEETSIITEKTSTITEETSTITEETTTENAESTHGTEQTVEETPRSPTTTVGPICKGSSSVDPDSLSSSDESPIIGIHPPASTKLPHTWTEGTSTITEETSTITEETSTITEETSTITEETSTITEETSTITEETTTENADSTLGTEQTVEETPRSPTTTEGPICKGSSSVDPDSLISSDESPIIGIHLPASTKLPHTWTEGTSTITEETSTITEETSTITEETSTITEETSTITEETTTENADSTLGTEQTVEETPRSPTTTEGPICKGSSSVDPDSLSSSDESPIIGIHPPASTKLLHTWTEETSTITEETSTITEKTSTITEETSTITEETTTENAESTHGTEQTVEETPRSPTTTVGPICKGSSSVDPDSLSSSDESPIIGIHPPASTKLPHTWTEGTSTITEETSTITEETSTITEETSTITEETSTITEETSTITEETTTENADSTLGTEQTVEETPRSPTTTEGPICKGSSSVDPDSLISSDESPIIGIHLPASTKLPHTWTEGTSTITEETSTITEETSTITEETSTITEETSTITEETTTENADSTLGTEQTVEETPRSPTTTEGPICKGSSSVDPDSLSSSDESPIIGIHPPASTKLLHTWTEETSTITEETSTITEKTSTITEETSTITEETTTENAESTHGTEQTVEETPRSPTTTVGPICKGSSSVDPDSLISSDESPMIGIHPPASTKLPHTWTEETSTITEETSTITEETSTITEETSTITEETTTENAESTHGTEQTVEETPRSPTTTVGPICKGSSSVDPDSLISSDESPMIGIHPPASTKLPHTWTEETSTITEETSTITEETSTITEETSTITEETSTITEETSTITEETTTENADSTLGTEQTVEETPRSSTTTVGPICKGSSSVDPDSLISSDESPIIGIHPPASTKLPHTWTEETTTITEETTTENKVSTVSADRAVEETTPEITTVFDPLLTEPTISYSSSPINSVECSSIASELQNSPEDLYTTVAETPVGKITEITTPVELQNGGGEFIACQDSLIRSLASSTVTIEPISSTETSYNKMGATTSSTQHGHHHSKHKKEKTTGENIMKITTVNNPLTSTTSQAVIKDNPAVVPVEEMELTTTKTIYPNPSTNPTATEQLSESGLTASSTNKSNNADKFFIYRKESILFGIGDTLLDSSNTEEVSDLCDGNESSNVDQNVDKQNNVTQIDRLKWPAESALLSTVGQFDRAIEDAILRLILRRGMLKCTET